MYAQNFQNLRRMLAEMNKLQAKNKINSKQMHKQQQQISRKIHAKTIRIKK